jgi:hypothetical protein
MAIGAKREVGPERRPRRIEAGRSGDRHWWRVGGDRIDLSPAASGWVARVPSSTPPGASYRSY